MLSGSSDTLAVRPLASRLQDARALAATPRPGYDARRRALGLLADRMLARDSALARLAAVPGYAFLAAFLNPDHLETMIAAEVPIDALRGFTPSGDRRSLRLVPRGLVCHWVAGNVPLLGMFSWAVSMLLGNVNVVRMSSRQDDFLSPLLEAMAAASPEGPALAAETLVLQFDREDETSHRQMSAAADVRIAWGGREAVESIISLPASWECDTIVLGPRVSMAVIDPQTVTAKALSRLATDIAYFDQQACSSPQFVFVKGRRGDERFEQAVGDLSKALAEQAGRFRRHPLDFGETYRIALDRARVALSRGDLHLDDDGTQWTVATVSAPLDGVRCANRFVQVVPFEAVDEVVPWIPRNVQSAVIALDADDTAAFTERAALRGVCRFPRPGQGNFFETPWDGVPLAARLTRWVVRAE